MPASRWRPGPPGSATPFSAVGRSRPTRAPPCPTSRTSGRCSGWSCTPAPAVSTCSRRTWPGNSTMPPCANAKRRRSCGSWPSAPTRRPRSGRSWPATSTPSPSRAPSGTSPGSPHSTAPSTYLQDAWRLAGDSGPGITWSNRNPHAALDQEPDRRIDYIFSGFHGPSGGGRPVECRVVADEPADGAWPSDHFGLLAVLQS